MKVMRIFWENLIYWSYQYKCFIEIVLSCITCCVSHAWKVFWNLSGPSVSSQSRFSFLWRNSSRHDRHVSASGGRDYFKESQAVVPVLYIFSRKSTLLSYEWAFSGKMIYWSYLSCLESILKPQRSLSLLTVPI